MKNLFSSEFKGLKRLQEVGLILSIALATFCMIALVSFNPSDPSWFQISWRENVANAAGTLGAMTAGVLFFLFGLVAYTVPLLLLLGGGYLLLCWRPLPWRDLSFFNGGLRVLGLVMIIVSTSTLASVNFNNFYFFSSGGLIGDLGSAVMIKALGNLGGTIVLLALLSAGITLLTGVSWVVIVETIGETLCRTILWLPIKLSRKPLDEDPIQSSDLSIQRQPMQVDKVLSRQEEGRDHNELFDSGSSVTAFRQEPTLEFLPAEMAETATVEAMITPVDSKTLDNLSSAQRSNSPASLPDISLLDHPDKSINLITAEELAHVSRLVETTLLDFNIQATVVAFYPGPVVTCFELDLAPGIKVSKITNLSKDLARALSKISVRIVEVIPGKSVIGLELPNKHCKVVHLSEVLNCPKFHKNPSPLTMVLGSNIAGEPVVVDLARMPHVLVAGTTGSGKSVGINVMIISLLYKSSPEDIRLIMIDPKILELSVYEGIPHLLTDVVTDMKEAANVLRWCITEMERRYKLMSALGVRNLQDFNKKVTKAMVCGQPIFDPFWKTGDSINDEPPVLKKIPSIVVVIDEFADMMIAVGKQVEELIVRIAQKARASGIHLILATQRPSVDVITGLIKANIPTRIAFQVSSKVDSRTILDQQGAETLLGQGDMLYLPPGIGVPIRVHGAFINDHEVHRVVADWKLRGNPDYTDGILGRHDAGSEDLLPSN